MDKYEVLTVCSSDHVKSSCDDLDKKGYKVMSVVYDGVKFVITGERPERIRSRNPITGMSE